MSFSTICWSTWLWYKSNW